MSVTRLYLVIGFALVAATLAAFLLMGLPYELRRWWRRRRHGGLVDLTGRRPDA